MTFEIELSPSGRTFTAAADQNILAAARAQGIILPSICRRGVCRTCRAKILEGEIDHNGSSGALTEQAVRDGFALLCQATPLSNLKIDIEIIAEGGGAGMMPAFVKDLKILNDEIALLKVRLLGASLEFAAGQYVDIVLPDRGRRSYSIANPPQAGGAIDIELHIQRLPGGAFTDQVFSGMKVRDKLQVEAPLGSFHLRDSQKPAVFLADGAGYAPTRSILMAALAEGGARAMTLYWQGRGAADLYMIDDARALAAAHANFTFVPVLSPEGHDPDWSGKTGSAQDVALADFPDLSNVQIYAAGPPTAIEAARQSFIARGLPEMEFFCEPFFSEVDFEADEA